MSAYRKPDRLKRPLTKAQAREDYISEAAYYFFRAAGPDENIGSALHRMASGSRRAILEEHGWSVPTPRTLYERAVDLFGIDRCHPAPQEKATKS